VNKIENLKEDTTLKLTREQKQEVEKKILDLEKDLFYLVKTTYKNITILDQYGFNTELLGIPTSDDIKSFDEIF
jgi:hypothetical protein